ncbi:beta-ketoacyl synthase [bacterium]|nr:beta-ketoacyl synthase [bacterium]
MVSPVNSPASTLGSATTLQNKRKVSLYGVGVTSPGAANLREFMTLVHEGKPALSPIEELQGAFLVGTPKFDFEVYREWISQRHAPNKFSQLSDKGFSHVRMAIGTSIDALESNPGLEEALKKIDPRVFVCYGSGFGDIQAYFNGHDEYKMAERSWHKFWAHPERNSALAEHINGKRVDPQAPESPTTFEIDTPERAAAWDKWNSFWCEKSDGLKEYLREFNEMESITIGADVATDKLNVIRAKSKAKKALQDKWKNPVPPWEAVNANLLWNLPNAPAAQVSMLHGIHGVSYAAIGACATFGLVLSQALEGIRTGKYDAAIVGTTDLPPPPELVAGFNAAKVLAAGCDVGVPLCNLRGTHVAGGACTWILAADDVMEKIGQKSFGIELLGVGLSSDAEHIITPSLEGPKLCIRDAFSQAGITPKDVHTWDMHATGTPGDWSEFKLIEDLPSSTIITARKGIFGHGMATCGGWELTAQLFSTNRSGTIYKLLGSGIESSRVHPSIREVGRTLATDKPMTVDAPNGLVCGKLSMGIGGISSCVLTKIH